MTLSSTNIEGRDQLVRDSVPYSMTSLSSLTICVRSVNDAISFLTTADAATVKIIAMLGRMRELAAQACRETCSALDRASLIQEYESLVVDMDHIAATTEWDGVKILYGCTKTINLFPAESPGSLTSSSCWPSSVSGGQCPCPNVRFACRCILCPCSYSSASGRTCVSARSFCIL